MKEQPVPAATDDDVERIALRDYGEARVREVLSIIGEYGKQSWNRPSPRVRLAILKLAGGDIRKLHDLTATAIQDYRDVLAWAEYPRYSREIGSGPVDESRRAEVIRADWLQYSEWLERK